MNSQLALPIERLRSMLEARFPGLETQMDAPDQKNGRWFLDLCLDRHSVDVQWTQEHGFGVSSQTDTGFGERAHETYSGIDEAYARILNLLHTKGRTTEGTSRLGELRQRVGLSQIEVAERLHCQQASISKLEHRSDLRLSTLKEYVTALGGTVEIRALLPGGIVTHLDSTTFVRKGAKR